MDSTQLDEILKLGKIVGREYASLKIDMENTREKIRSTKEALTELQKLLR